MPRPCARGSTSAIASVALSSEARPQDSSGSVTPVSGSTPTLPRQVTNNCASSSSA